MWPNLGDPAPGFGCSGRTTRRTRGGEKCCLLQYKEASAFGRLELQEKTYGQEQPLFYMPAEGERDCLIPGSKGLPSADENQTCCLASVPQNLEQSGEIMSMGTARGADRAHGSNEKCPWGQAQPRNALFIVLLGAADSAAFFASRVPERLFELTPQSFSNKL